MKKKTFPDKYLFPNKICILLCTRVMGEWCPGQSSQGQGKDNVFTEAYGSGRDFLSPMGTWLLIVCVYGLFPYPVKEFMSLMQVAETSISLVLT